MAAHLANVPVDVPDEDINSDGCWQAPHPRALLAVDPLTHPPDVVVPRLLDLVTSRS
jgi:hypothetical protein